MSLPPEMLCVWGGNVKRRERHQGSRKTRNNEDSPDDVARPVVTEDGGVHVVRHAAVVEGAAEEKKNRGRE